MSGFLTDWTIEPNVNDVEKEVALRNTKLLQDIMERLMKRFERSVNFSPLWASHKWVNHPDNHYVVEGRFAMLCEHYLSEISMRYFLTEMDWCDHWDEFCSFSDACQKQYDDITFDEVERACDQMEKLYNALCDLSE